MIPSLTSLNNETSKAICMLDAANDSQSPTSLNNETPEAMLADQEEANDSQSPISLNKETPEDSDIEFEEAGFETRDAKLDKRWEPKLSRSNPFSDLKVSEGFRRFLIEQYTKVRGKMIDFIHEREDRNAMLSQKLQDTGAVLASLHSTGHVRGLFKNPAPKRKAKKITEEEEKAQRIARDRQETERRMRLGDRAKQWADNYFVLQHEFLKHMLPQVRSLDAEDVITVDEHFAAMSAFHELPNWEAKRAWLRSQFVPDTNGDLVVYLQDHCSDSPVPAALFGAYYGISKSWFYKWRKQYTAEAGKPTAVAITSSELKDRRSLVTV